MIKKIKLEKDGQLIATFFKEKDAEKKRDELIAKGETGDYKITMFFESNGFEQNIGNKFY